MDKQPSKDAAKYCFLRQEETQMKRYCGKDELRRTKIKDAEGQGKCTRAES